MVFHAIVILCVLVWTQRGLLREAPWIQGASAMYSTTGAGTTYTAGADATDKASAVVMHSTTRAGTVSTAVLAPCWSQRCVFRSACLSNVLQHRQSWVVVLLTCASDAVKTETGALRSPPATAAARVMYSASSAGAVINATNTSDTGAMHFAIGAKRWCEAFHRLRWSGALLALMQHTTRRRCERCTSQLALVRRSRPPERRECSSQPELVRCSSLQALSTEWEP